MSQNYTMNIYSGNGYKNASLYSKQWGIRIINSVCCLYVHLSNVSIKSDVQTVVICVRSWRKQETARCIANSQFILIYDAISWREAETTLNSHKYLSRNITIYIGWDINLLKINLDSVKNMFTSCAFEEIVFIVACLEKFNVPL